MKWIKGYLLLGMFIIFIVLLAGLTSCGGVIETTISTDTPTTATTPAMSFQPPGGIFSDNRTPPSMDWATAAAKLGITEEKLRQALDNNGQGIVDLAQAAAAIGVTVDELREVLGFPEGGPGGPGKGPMPNGTSPTDIPPFTPPDAANDTNTKNLS